MNKHTKTPPTPTPWKWTGTNKYPKKHIYLTGAENIPILFLSNDSMEEGGISVAEGIANARHIVKCVNSHNALVEQLRYLIYRICSGCKSYNTKTDFESNMCSGNSCETIDRAKQALAGKD